MSIDWQNKIITVSAAIILNTKNEILVARKKGTNFYMQIGGKLEKDETPETSLIREIKEEIGLDAQITHYYGCFNTQAANEENFKLKAYLFLVETLGNAQACAELEDLKWIDCYNSQELPLAPLTEKIVLPIIQNL